MLKTITFKHAFKMIFQASLIVEMNKQYTSTAKLKI